MVLNMFIHAKTEIIKDTFCLKLHEDILAVDHGECERGNLTRTGSEFENELMRIRHNFLRIRDTNINFILCQFQNRNILFVNTTQPFEIDIE